MFEQDDSSSGRSFAVGILLGALVGAGLALLFAPQSGEETRRLIRKKTKRFAREAGDKIDDIRDNVKQIRRRAEKAIAD